MLLLVALAGAVAFLIGLGHTGLVDETPALFAASARRMAESGDWLIPWVNGLPRYDKPPLVYWLMGSLYALPGSGLRDPLGSWAARLPSALATIATMVALADTLLRWPQPAATSSATPRSDRTFTAVSAALAFGLSPLVLVWGRTEVSDALFTSTLALSGLLAWRTYAAEHGPWWPCWGVLALAVLSKGPVALVLLPLSLGVFWFLGADGHRLRRRLRPLPGLAFSLVLAGPWYGLALLREGQPYWDSFFGYHNLQRYTRVVNNHQQGWGYYLAVLLLAGLPFTPLLLARLHQELRTARRPMAPSASLGRFAAAWLLAVLLFFSFSATKLPSYWLVATPAAALLVALAPTTSPSSRGLRLALATSLVLLLGISAALAAAPLWLSFIHDPSLPGLAEALARRPWLLPGAVVALLAAMLLKGSTSQRPSQRLLCSQLPLLLLVPFVLLPVWQIGDQLRGAPLRRLAAVAAADRTPSEALAMVGMRKPSLHFYSRATVLFEGRSPAALVNLADRLRAESRPGLHPAPPERQPTLLLVIDAETAARPHWRNLQGEPLAQAGPYRLWRLDRGWLEARADRLRAEGHGANWREPRPERF